MVNPQILTDESKINETMQSAGDSLITRAHHFLQQGSNWRILSVNFQYIDILLYKPLEASSYFELPPELQHSRKGLVNIIVYCLLYHLHQNKIIKDPERVSKYKQYENTVDFSDIDFPVANADIHKIERKNNIAVNVLAMKAKPHFLFI